MWEGLEEEVQTDPKLKNIVQEMLVNPRSHPGYQLKNGRLYKEYTIVIPKQSPRIQWLLTELHDSAVGGHSGFFRTYKKILACEVCQRNKYQTLNPGGLIQPLPVPSQTWSDISMDFIGGLPKAQGVDTILVVVDRFTKYAHFMALCHPYTAKDVAELFTREVVKLHGFSSSIVSDRDKIFLSTFWSELFKLSGTKLKYNSAYQPQTDGQTRVVNRCLETYIRCLTGQKPKQ